MIQKQVGKTTVEGKRKGDEKERSCGRARNIDKALKVCACTYDDGGIDTMPWTH